MTTARPLPRVRIALEIDLAYRIDAPGADFILNIQPAHTSCQSVAAEQLSLNQSIAAQIETDALTGNRYLRLRALPGELKVAYRATVDVQHHHADPDELAEIPIARLPLDALQYIYPSRYCESDKLLRLAMKEFGNLPQGYRRVQAIKEWVQRQITYVSNTSNPRTSAVDTLVEQAGVCRDFSHLMIALCRAVNIPARFTTGTDFGADRTLGPPDFHAYVEVLVGNRWYIFDPSATGIPMGFVRIGTGRDAADVAFATIFGGVIATAAPLIRAVAADNPAAGFSLPAHTDLAVSTASA
ncbi:transglutaminase-like putative cysteine protease [Cupriavidus gilardii J11]|uniref:Transglutaminase-like putative cysteine protease n=1 Tax=Cupriavidus gilardii J11 TaxID=936133 RepID=A0A562B2D1_9BURK|nr:transglutaminase family protein [Cupriavidus gilardii]TWG79060.1 transglutaminase-like putative cysteine protease [Cupriavidus gilardii J11]